MDYVELMRYIENTHPTVELSDAAIQKKIERGILDPDQPEIAFHAFPICDNIGTLRPAVGCCPMETTEMAKQLGLGPTLFLMSTKAMSWFFLFMTILNVPVMAFYLSGNDSDIKMDGVTDLFALMSMGNVGQTGLTCDGVDMTVAYEVGPRPAGTNNEKEQRRHYERGTNITMNCGLGSKIGSLIYAGISKNRTTTCKSILRLKDPNDFKTGFSDTCYYRNSSENKLFTGSIGTRLK